MFVVRIVTDGDLTVYRSSITAHVQVRRGTLGSPVTQTYYAHQDDLFSVLALRDG